ncbi:MULTISPECIES: FMN-binding protein [unclassified Treponema]|uniref:FMN-binding protein n=1 Tax=unclassified Treponema TaxID=2638727 RepID=UPI0020A39465|nr:MULTISPECIES: FMN-binding protein [unclassified Treponema]UTC67350.1 FMN-binding protein [Treponema sp. OMZ 789]UTC70078.1 FMN-binding protein [Treponema sp. OMZ 790]UTC72794.1 FMN-binding protein [Treponema sp. OMZ 791]
MKQMIKLACTLSAYAVIACLALAAVYSFTAPRIAEVKAEKTNMALKAVFPEADDFKEISSEIPESLEKTKFLNAYLAVKDGKAAGITITASGKTYAKATILVAFDLNKVIRKIEFLELTDTPSLGSKAAEEPFKGQFTGKSMESPFSVREDINAIGGATITSKGVSAIIKDASVTALDYITKNNLEGGK